MYFCTVFVNNTKDYRTHRGVLPWFSRENCLVAAYWCLIGKHKIAKEKAKKITRTMKVTYRKRNISSTTKYILNILSLSICISETWISSIMLILYISSPYFWIEKGGPRRILQPLLVIQINFVGGKNGRDEENSKRREGRFLISGLFLCLRKVAK